MALLKCPECGEHVSEFAKACPNCGCPMSDIAQENQVVDKSWDKKREKRNTATQVYSQEELDQALEQAKSGNDQKQRKPGQKRIVKNSESVLTGRNRNKKKKTSKAKQNDSSHKLPLKVVFIIIGILAVIGIGAFCYSALSGLGKDVKNSTDITTEQENTRQKTYYNYETENSRQTTEQTTEKQTKPSKKPTTKETKQTTQKQTTTKATTEPVIQEPETEPPEETMAE